MAQSTKELGPDQVIAEVSLSGLRGRGGAGFPTGTKWASVREGGGRHHYAVCNGAEGEPATFKDRALMRANPYQIIEGLLIAPTRSRRSRPTSPSRRASSVNEMPSR